MLELRDVTRAAGREPMLARASLTFTREVPTAVLGLSPEGREGLLRLLAGADKPQAGTVKLDGKDIGQARREKGRIVRVGPHGIAKSGQRVSKLIGAEAAARVRLSGKLDASVNDLDLDQRLRLAIAKARADRAGLILLDGPSLGLDHEIRDRFVADLGAMLGEVGAVVVLVASSADEAFGLGGKVVVLGDGKVVQEGQAADVFAHPANLLAALATSYPALNTLPMMVREGRGVLADGSSFAPPPELTMPSEGACTLAFRPDDTTLVRAGTGCVRFVVRAAGEQVLGGRRFLRIKFAEAIWLTPQLAAAPPAGAVLNAFVERRKLMAFDGAGKAVG
jgi:ABC-type sulfate/molybdate transport systems ATPase subunit